MAYFEVQAKLDWLAVLWQRNIMDRKMLWDIPINIAQHLLKKEFPNSRGYSQLFISRELKQLKVEGQMKQ